MQELLKTLRLELSADLIRWNYYFKLVIFRNLAYPKIHFLSTEYDPPKLF